MICTPCRLGRNWECEGNEYCNSTGNNSNSSVQLGISDSNISSVVEEDEEDSSESSGERRIGKTYKLDAVLRDQQSTGRKRAAVKFPLDREADCEWLGMKSCGGGSSPICGCMAGKQEARHHGPDKNTLNNDDDNVHRICHSCHNNWHAANDKGYIPGGIINPHSPTKASEFELMAEQVRRAGSKLKNVVD